MSVIAIFRQQLSLPDVSAWRIAESTGSFFSEVVFGFVSTLGWENLEEKSQAPETARTLQVGRAKRGYIVIRGTKSRNSKRNISLTATAQSILARQRQISECEYVFVRDGDHTKPSSVSAVNHCHERVRTALEMPPEFVLHSLRHTFGTRLGESGCDAFTIMRLMGHSTITVSQRYMHGRA